MDVGVRHALVISVTVSFFAPLGFYAGRLYFYFPAFPVRYNALEVSALASASLRHMSWQGSPLTDSRPGSQMSR